MHNDVKTNKAEMVDTGWGCGERLRKCKGLGDFDSLAPQTQRPLLVFPVFLDVEVPLPGQMVMLVVVSKLRFDDVVAAGQNTFGSLLHCGQEIIFSGTRPVAAHHVV